MKTQREHTVRDALNNRASAQTLINPATCNYSQQTQNNTHTLIMLRAFQQHPSSGYMTCTRQYSYSFNITCTLR